MSSPRKAVLLCALMLLMSISPLLISTSAEEGEEAGTVVDTGWVRIEVPENGSADFHHLVPYGVQMTDLSFEIRVDGSNDLFLTNPLISSPEAGVSLLDWSNGPGLGRLFDFTGGDPHNGRMSPRSDATATWTLPEGSTVQSVIMEALRPVDPLVSLSPFVLDIQASAIHPDDGRLYLAIDGSLLMLDATASPPIIDRIENVDLVSLVVMAEDDQLLGLARGGGIECWSLSTGDGCSVSNVPDATHLGLDAAGVLWAAGAGQLHSLASSGMWTEAISIESNGLWPDEPVTALHFIGDEILVGTEGGGVARWNRVADVREVTWSTANNLPSDSISDIVDNDGTLFVATPDEGLARKDLASGNWLAVWHEGNWLSSNDVRDISVHGAAVSILTDSALQVYDTSQGGFTGTSTLDDMGLSQTGMDLVIWPAGASRSPLVTALLVSDGSGRLAVLDAAAAPQALGDLLLATTPTNTEVHDVLELDGILYAAGDRGIDRFDIRARAWMTSLDPEYGVIGMATDGSRLFSVGDELSIDVWARNGTLLQSMTMGMSAEPTALAWDPLTGSLLITLGEDGLARLEMSSGSIDIWNDNDDFQQGHAFDVVARNGIAFVAIEGEGIARVDLVNEEILGSWRSSGVDDAAQAPIAVSGDRVYLGLYDAGVFIFDRDSGELVETWAQEDEEWWWLEDDWDATQFATLPNSWITALHVDMDGDVYVGHETGFSRRSDDGFDSPGNGEQWFFGGKTTGFASEGSTLYALQEWQGVCLYRRSDLHQRECWNDRPNSDVRIDTTGGQSLTIPSPNRLYVSTDHGAYLIDTLNETLLQEWSTGGSSWNTPVVVYDDVAHLAVDGVGVVRYDLDAQQWLSTWNAASGILPEDGVTALSDDVTASHLWVGGDFGLIEIDMSTGTQIRHWDHEHNPSVSRFAPQQLVRIDEVLHYLETPPERRDFPIDIDDINDALGDNGNSNGRQRQGQNQPSTRVFRYDVDSGQKLSTLNPTARFNRELSIIGMENVRSDELWIGVGKPYGYFWSDEPGGIARWDSGSSNWLGDIEPDTVNNNDGIAALIGACDVASIQADADGCHILSSYGDFNHRLLAMDSTVEFELDASDLDETVRAVVTWDGHGLLATADGVVRIDASDWTMADTWTAGNGLPPSASDNVRSLEIVDDDLWMITKSSSSSSRAQIHRLDGLTDSWMTWSGSSTEEIPAGTGVSIQKCSDIVYFAFEGEVWDGEGGIARYDTINDDWLDPFEAEWRDWGPDPDEEGLMWSSVTSLACDDENILYAGLDEGDYGIQRYDTEEDEWLESLDPWDHDFSSSGITNDAMAWADGTLAFGHEQGGNFGFDEGAFSLVAVRGDWVGGGRSVDEGITTSSVVAYPQLPGMGADWLVAQPGASGPGRAKLFDSMGGEVGVLDAWTGLVDGRARHFAGNTTHVYAALLASDMDRTDGAATILEGTQAGEGDIEWERSWDLPHASIERLLLEDGILWVTTRYGGLYRIDLASGEMAGMPPTAHESLSMMTLHDGDIVVGMSAVEMAAGVSVFDRDNERWTDSALLPGLPSPQVNDIVEADGHIWFATNGGIGSWDIAGGDWGPTISAADGLGSGDARSLELIGGELWVATTGGLCAVDTSTTSTTGPQVRHCMTRSNGLVGTSSVEIASAGGLLYVSHDGFGPTRPGATQVRSVSRTALTQYHADSLPSNDVTAIAADGWGVHIATEEQPLSHWNAASNQMEHGAIAVDTGGWPITSFSSDGTTLLAATSGVMHRIAVNAIGHPVINSTRAPGIQATFQGSLGTWVAAGEDGVRPYGAAPGYEVLPQVIDRRANPLRATIGGVMTDITAEARPGNEFSITAGAVIGEYVDALTLSEVPLILSSDVEGAAVWAKTTQLDYNGSWDLAATEAGMRALLMAVAFGTTNASGHDLHLNFASPKAGAVEVRLSYIAVTSNSPVQMLLLEDRPNDGGDALVATWTPTMEAGFTAYELSVDDGSQVNTITIPDRFNVQTVISGLDSNTAYNVWVEVVYSNGNHSNASNTIGPVTPFDDIPLAPAWGNAALCPECGVAQVLVEWEYCSALDHYASWPGTFLSPPSPLTSYESGQGIGQGGSLPDNQTIHFATGAPIWVMIYCIDRSDQIDFENPLILGPISTSADNDTEAPGPLEWVSAADHPNDAGGALDISWAASEAPDCALYAVHLMPVNAAWPPQSADAAPLVQWISGCETTETTITGLRDGQPYWATVVAYDANLNVDLLNSPWASATPEADLRVDEPPARVTMVTATDVADDSGHAIEVSWTPVLDADLTHYTVWVSEHDVSDVSEMWSRCSFYLDTCAEKVMMSETIVLNQALYGDELERSVRVLIRPDVELSVAVTAHGGEGGVHLSDLVTTTVMPVDDLRDEEAPPRMARPILSDVADDDGRALWMEFMPSEADDVAWYAVYVEAWAFTSACDLQPAMLLPTDAEQPIFLGRYSSGRFLEPGEDATVAIVAVDGAANANCADVLTTTMAPINNGPPPVTEPPVTGLAGEWIENGTALKLTWTRTDAARGGLSIHISQSRFAEAGEAELIAFDVDGDSIILRDESLDSSKPLWVAITNDHQEGAIVEVTPVEITPFGVDTTTDPETFSDLGVVLAAVIALIALGALTVFFVMRRGRDGDSMGLDHAGLVSDDMDQTNDMWKMDEPESEPEPDPLPEFVPEEKPTVEEDVIDTSFLDDLL